MSLNSIYSKFRKPILGLLRYLPGVRQRARAIYYRKRSKDYDNMAEGISTDPKTVLFACFGGRQYACSPRAIYESMIKDSRFDEFTFVWAFKEEKIEDLSNDPSMRRAQIIPINTEEYLRTCARAKYWVFNTRVAEYIVPKPDQIYVQCWHGTPIKRLGYDVTIQTQNALNTTDELAERFGMDSQKWTYLISPSSYTSQHLADAFGLPEHRRPKVLLEEGYPRNDCIVRICSNAQACSEFVEKFRDEHEIPSGKKILLYAPTWRDDDYQSGKGYVMEDTLLDFEALQEALGDTWVILFRAHYYIANHFDFSAYEGFVYDVSRQVDINDLYIVADVLLTDYSSVFFDYANTGRPIIFFWPDYEHYANDIRGFYFDLDELPGPHCFTNDEVIDAVKRISDYGCKYGEEYDAFRQRFCSKDDGHAAERVINKVFAKPNFPYLPQH